MPGMADTATPPKPAPPSAAPTPSGLRPSPHVDGDGCMLALYPDEATAATLALQGGTPGADLHLTVAYLGKAAGVDPDAAAALAQSVAAAAPPILGEISGAARFTGQPGGDPLVALYDSPDLEDLRGAILTASDGAGVTVARNHGYTPHITLGYLAADVDSPVKRIAATPLRFDTLVLVHGTNHTPFPLAGMDEDAAEDAAAPEVTGDPDDDEDGENAQTKAAVVDATPPEVEVPLPPEIFQTIHGYTRDPNAVDDLCLCGAPPADPIHSQAGSVQDELKAFGGRQAPPFGTDKGAGGKKPPGVGTWVSVGNVKGRVDLVVTNGDVPAATGSDDKPVTGTAESPAVRVVVYESAGGGMWAPTKRKIAAPASGVKRSAPLRARQAKSLDEAIAGMLLDHAEAAGDDFVVPFVVPDAATVLAVHGRGAESWPGETKTTLTAEEWGIGRVEAFLATIAGMRPDGYVGDDDLLPTDR